MQLRTNFTVLCALAVGVLGSKIALAEGESPPAPRMPSNQESLIRVGHDSLDVDPALKRYAGMVTALGPADAEGRIYSFQAARLPAAPGYLVNELRGWRLTVLAGKRFASVFEVESNTDSEITVASRDGPLNGLAVRDVFVVERIAIDREESSDQSRSKPGS